MASPLTDLVDGTVFGAAQVNPIIARANQFIVCTSTTRPTRPQSGWHVYETDTGKVRLWTGAGWAVITGRTGGSWRRVAFQSIPNTTPTAISWDTEDADTDGFLSPSSTTATIPAGLGGVYAVTAFGYAGADGEIHITASGTDIAIARTNSRTGQGNCSYRQAARRRHDHHRRRVEQLRLGVQLHRLTQSLDGVRMTTTLHLDRYAPTTILRKNGVVVHDSEGGEGVLSWGQTASDQLLGYLRSKGDRPSPSRPGGVYGSGYHAVATETGSYVVVAEANTAPYHAPPVNPTMWSICMPGKAAQTRDQWLDAPSRNYIRGVAAYIVDRWNDDGRVWPLQFVDAGTLVVTAADKAGHPAGYTSHAQVSQAWHKTDHTDPGVSFHGTSSPPTSPPSPHQPPSPSPRRRTS